MKKFSFPLDRILSWRRTQVRLEEAKLARLNAGLQTVHSQMATLSRSVDTARSQFIATRSAHPMEIAALEHFRSSTAAQTQHLAREASSLEAKIAQQMGIVIGRRRDAQLLERLREHRLGDWRRAAAQEVEQQAEESYLARFTRSSQSRTRMQSADPMR